MKLQPENGIVVGVVTDLDDPEGAGRVRVRFPYLGDVESAWARLVVLMAGGGRGTFFRPEVGDEVLVAFEHGEPRRPYVLGGLWSRVDRHPEGGPAAENNLRLIQSRSGHVLRFDDTAGSEKIEILDKDGQRKVILDSSGQKIRIVCEAGDVEVSAKAGKVKVEAAQVEVTATDSLKLAAARIEVKAQGTLELSAGGPLTVKGAVINLN